MKKTAFTLIELLIVIMIIGILATMAIPQYNKIVEKARSAEAVSILGVIRQTELIYHAEYGTYLDVDQLPEWGRGGNWAVLGIEDPNLTGKFYYNASPPSPYKINAWSKKFGTDDPEWTGKTDKLIQIILDSGEIKGGWPH